jgi:exodeoxyribonuclease VII large subunit
VKVEALDYGDRRVYTVAAFNGGVADWLRRLPELWVEGEVTELRRHPRWASVFFTLKDPGTSACLNVSIDRRRFERLQLELADGEQVHVLGRAELYAAKGSLSFRAATIERFGLGAHLAALERRKRLLAAEGLFAPERKRPLPRFPRAVGLLTGSDAAARGDLVSAITTRFPPARIVVAETRVQGRGAPLAIVNALRALAAHPAVDVVVVARGGGSFEDLLPFSDEAVVRSVAGCGVPVVSAVGHEQDTPLCDLAADARASTPTAAARLVVPDLNELRTSVERSGKALERSVRELLRRRQEQFASMGDRLHRAPRLLLERHRAGLDVAAARLTALSPRATLERGYAIVRARGDLVRDAAAVAAGERIDVELASGGLGAVVEEIRK